MNKKNRIKRSILPLIIMVIYASIMFLGCTEGTTEYGNGTVEIQYDGEWNGTITIYRKNEENTTSVSGVGNKKYEFNNIKRIFVWIYKDDDSNRTLTVIIRGDSRQDVDKASTNDEHGLVAPSGYVNENDEAETIMTSLVCCGLFVGGVIIIAGIVVIFIIRKKDDDKKMQPRQRVLRQPHPQNPGKIHTPSNDEDKERYKSYK